MQVCQSLIIQLVKFHYKSTLSFNIFVWLSLWARRIKIWNNKLSTSLPWILSIFKLQYSDIIISKINKYVHLGCIHSFMKNKITGKCSLTNNITSDFQPFLIHGFWKTIMFLNNCHKFFLLNNKYIQQNKLVSFWFLLAANFLILENFQTVFKYPIRENSTFMSWMTRFKIFKNLFHPISAVALFYILKRFQELTDCLKSKFLLTLASIFQIKFLKPQK